MNMRIFGFKGLIIEWRKRYEDIGRIWLVIYRRYEKSRRRNYVDFRN